MNKIRSWSCQVFSLLLLLPALPALAAPYVIDARKTGTYTTNSGGTFASPDYTTGITFAYGAESRGFASFDLTGLPAGTIESATLSLLNPYSANEAGGLLELRLYGLPYVNSSNYTGNTYLNASVFSAIGNPSPHWGTVFVATPTSWPGNIIRFDLPHDALATLRQAADGASPAFARDFFAFGLRIVKADAEEPKPLQYVFGGTAAGGGVQLSLDIAPLTPVPEPRSSLLLLSGLAFFGIAFGRRVKSA